MKRHVALQHYSKEHQHTLALALRIKNAINADKHEQLHVLAEEVGVFYNNTLKKHFENEEESFFSLLNKHYPEHKKLVLSYLKEHEMLSQLSSQIADKPENVAELLMQYSTLLTLHTRKEERQLFPLIEQCFSPEELQSLTTS